LTKAGAANAADLETCFLLPRAEKGMGTDVFSPSRSDCSQTRCDNEFSMGMKNLILISIVAFVPKIYEPKVLGWLCQESMM
jgi:hypothetical protein